MKCKSIAHNSYSLVRAFHRRNEVLIERPNKIFTEVALFHARLPRKGRGWCRKAEIQCINSIRVLAAETVQKAKSGHPGGFSPVL